MNGLTFNHPLPVVYIQPPRRLRIFIYAHIIADLLDELGRRWVVPVTPDRHKPAYLSVDVQDPLDIDLRITLGVNLEVCKHRDGHEFKQHPIRPAIFQQAPVFGFFTIRLEKVPKLEVGSHVPAEVAQKWRQQVPRGGIVEEVWDFLLWNWRVFAEYSVVLRSRSK